MNRPTYISLIALALLLGGAWSAPAQGPISLDEYRERVLDYSYTLKMARENRAAAEAGVRQSYTGFLPALSAAGDFSVNFKDRYAVSNGASQLLHPYAFSLQPALVQNIYTGGAVRNSYEQAKISSEIARYGEEQSQLSVAYLAEYNYWNLASNEALLAIATRYEGIVRNMYNVVRTRFDDGYVAKNDLLMIETRLREAEYSRVNADNLYRVSLQNFNILMGAVPLTQHTVADSVTMPVQLPMYAGVQEALSRRPDYLSADRRVEYNRYGVKLASAKFNPQLSAGVQGLWRNNTPNLGGTDLDGLAFLRLSVPIFHWGERRHAVTASQAAVRSSEYEKLQLIDNITQEIMTAWTNIVESASQIDIARANLEVARENLSLNTFSYNEGLLTILDVISAQLSWLQAYTNTITANFNQKVAIAAYHKAIADTGIQQSYGTTSAVP